MPAAGEKWIALTCDDGGDFDFHDLPHPACGIQRSVINRLRDFASAHPRYPVHVTSFVIVSPDARAELDKTCMIGRGWWNEGWWRDARASGLMDIGNHSWDHNHDALPERFSHGVPRGTFSTISTSTLADLEIRRSSEYLKKRVPSNEPMLFAYPYGESNEYLRREYFPAHADELSIAAAFGDEPRYLTPDADVWNLPRFICGRDWRTPHELAEILVGAGAVSP